MKNLTLTETRNQLLRVAQDMEDHPDAVVGVRKRGKPVMAILSIELYESLIETLEVLGDEADSARLRQAIREIEQGRGIPWKSAKRKLGLED